MVAIPLSSIYKLRPLLEAPPLISPCSSPRSPEGTASPFRRLGPANRAPSSSPRYPAHPPAFIPPGQDLPGAALTRQPGLATRPRPTFCPPGHAHLSVTYLHNWLKGAKGAIAGAPVIAVAVHALLQDVLFAGEAYMLIGHPPAGRASDGSARAGLALFLGPPCAGGGDYSHAAEHVDGLCAGSVLR